MKKQFLIFNFFAFLLVAAQTFAFGQVNENVVVFSGIQDSGLAKSSNSKKRFGCNDPIYAKAQFAGDRVDVTNGFAVVIDVDGETVFQKKMQAAEEWNWITIPLELIPDETAEIRFPAASLAIAEQLLENLQPGLHTVEVGVAVDAETVSIGSFEFDNRRNCSADNLKRVRRAVESAESGGGNQETSDDEPEKEQEKTEQPAEVQETVEVVNNCDKDRFVAYRQPNGNQSTLIVTPGFPKTMDFPVGTQFHDGSNLGDPLILRLQATGYTNNYQKYERRARITLCK